jgi:hypothetical protein
MRHSKKLSVVFAAATMFAACGAMGQVGERQPPPTATTPRPPEPAGAERPVPTLPSGQAQAEVERAQAQLKRAEQAAANQAANYYFALQGKKEKAAFLGVSGSPLVPALREQLRLPKGVGLVVDYVEPKSPAEEAGLKQYDVLHKIEDQLLINAHQFAVLVRLHRAGDEVTLTIIRGGESKQVRARLTEKEVMALDDQNPWGTPPTPFGAANGMDVLTTATVQPKRLAITQGPGGGFSVSGNFGKFSGNATFGAGGGSAGGFTGGGFGSGTASGFSGGGGFSGPGAGGSWYQKGSENVRVWTDGSVRLNITENKSGKHLLVTDKDGKPLFSGPIDTPEQRQAVPKEYQEKLQKLESMPKPKVVPPTTRPLNFVPGFGQPKVIRLRKVGEHEVVVSDEAGGGGDDEVPTQIEVLPPGGEGDRDVLILEKPAQQGP